MLTHRITRGWAYGSEGFSKTIEISAGGQLILSETIPAGSVNLDVAFALDVSQAKVLALISDQDVTVKTNDGAAPDNTFTLPAGKPFIWINGDPALRDTGGTAVVTDIAKLVVSNAGDSDAVLQVSALFDPTV